jgi:hypothetical protein
VQASRLVEQLAGLEAVCQWLGPARGARDEPIKRDRRPTLVIAMTKGETRPACTQQKVGLGV